MMKIKKCYLIVLLLTIFCIGLPIHGKAQTINRQFPSESLLSRIEAVLSDCKCKITFDSNQLRDIIVPELNAKNVDVEQVLTKSLSDTEYTYVKTDQNLYVITSRQPEKTNNSNPSDKVTVSGRILELNGEPIIGATIVYEGKGVGTASDIDGNFSLEVPKNSTLVVSYVGFVTQKIIAESNKNINITLQENTKLLDEIVVIGYGTVTKGSITGSVSSIKQSDMQGYASSNFAEMVAGKATGVQIVQAQGTPGSEASIKVRGTGTLTAGNNPLIVVDGFPLTEGTGMNSINPNSIASIEFLKDAASTAIYGSRGANGVVMIKTKEGVKGKPVVTLNSYYGVQQRADNLRLVNAYEMAQFLLEARNTGYLTKDPKNRSESDNTATRLSKGASKRELIPDYLYPYLNNEKGLTNTDWLGEIFRTAPIQNHSVNVTGAGDNVNYAVSGNYFKQDGIIIGSDFERFANNINLKIKINDKFNTGISLSPSYSKQNTFDTGGGWNYNLLDIALISYPFFSPYNSDGSLAISKQIEANIPTDGALSENPIAISKMTSHKNENFRMFGNTYLEYKFLNSFNFKTSLGGDYEAATTRFFDPSTVGRYRTPAPDETTAYETKDVRRNYLVENLLSYRKTLNDHHFDGIIGQSYQYENYNKTKVTAFDFPDNTITNIAGGTSFKVEPTQYSWSMISYFTRLNYAYNDKYFASASIRRDGSSRFGMNSKWGVFPAFSGGWTLTNEDFFPKTNAVKYLKLRTSWGKTGNNQIPNFGAKALLKDDNYILDNSLAPGTATSTAPNPNLSWEISESWNFGLDMHLFNNFLSVTADFYIADTKNLLLEVPVPEQSGYSTSLQNIGKVRNSGFEIQLTNNKDIKLGPVSLTSSLNVSTNKNKVLALAPGQEQIIAGAGGFARTRVGGPISEMYGYSVSGVYKTQDQIDKSIHMDGTLVGDYIIDDINGDEVIDTKDKMGFGTATPEMIIGFNNNFKYRDFEFMFDLYSELGKKIYSRSLASVIEAGEGFSMVSKEYFDNRFHPINNPGGTYATPNMGNFSNNRKEARQSNKFFDDASYLRLRILKLTYNLPQTITQRIGLQRVSFNVTGNNLITLTPYKGFNVDSDSKDLLARGYDNANYPVAKSILFGLNINF